MAQYGNTSHGLIRLSDVQYVIGRILNSQTEWMPNSILGYIYRESLHTVQSAENREERMPPILVTLTSRSDSNF